MAEQKQNFTPYVIAGVVGLAFVGYQQSAKNQADNVSNLPALEARISSIEERVTKEIDSMNNQINRREVENRNEKDKDIAVLTQRVERDEERLTYVERILGVSAKK